MLLTFLVPFFRNTSAVALRHSVLELSAWNGIAWRAFSSVPHQFSTCTFITFTNKGDKGVRSRRCTIEKTAPPANNDTVSIAAAAVVVVAASGHNNIIIKQSTLMETQRVKFREKGRRQRSNDIRTKRWRYICQLPLGRTQSVVFSPCAHVLF